MNKRYQVFVSSTYADLKDERHKVIQTLMEMDCIPAGMELFPASDDEQWDFIKKVIDDCDYYVLILGGRYGSISASGMSFTEREFDYAVSKPLKILAFVHGSPEKLSIEHSELGEDLRHRLSEFRKKVCSNRLVKFWNSASELPGLVALALTKMIKTYPAEGWVRANQIATSAALSDINALAKENRFLKGEIKALEDRIDAQIKKNEAATERLADMDEAFDFVLYSEGDEYEVSENWSNLFRIIAPRIAENAWESWLRKQLCSNLAAGQFGTFYLPDETFDTIRAQFTAYGFIETRYWDSEKDRLWGLTEAGDRAMLNAMTVKSTKKPKLQTKKRSK
ncbi:hypothetical protein FHS83_000489 [Rhizomicrobium palustre]|uniref:DUF4062 domain-containing protein n=1 Tax=Rhizomicrobium palustre TaxID=189966 RepID=A0A846MVH8_9PROT|nr:DUF4062 domain-containing protein [Rhizomicrobium palustre]NIK87171.1 hypothetical protein [Rhizomicrobium palustre]